MGWCECWLGCSKVHCDWVGLMNLVRLEREIIDNVFVCNARHTLYTFGNVAPPPSTLPIACIVVDPKLSGLDCVQLEIVINSRS